MKIKKVSLNNLSPLHSERRMRKSMLMVMDLLGNKTTKVCAYLIKSIPMKQNLYFINRTRVANELNCTPQTVSNAVKILKKDRFIQVNGNYIKLNYKEMNN